MKDVLFSKTVNFDALTSDIVFIEHEHYEIHKGGHWTFTDRNTVDDTNTREYLLIGAPSKYVHLTWQVKGSLGGVQIDAYQVTTKSSNGTDMSSHFLNNKTYEVDTATGFQIFHTPTISVETQKYWDYIGGAGANPSKGSTGGQDRGVHEFILGKSAIWHLKLTSGIDNNVITVLFSWYEESKA